MDFADRAVQASGPCFAPVGVADRLEHIRVVPFGISPGSDVVPRPCVSELILPFSEFLSIRIFTSQVRSAHRYFF